MLLLQIPTVIYLERVDVQGRLDFSMLPKQLDPSILCQDTSIALYVLILVVDVCSTPLCSQQS